MMCPARFVKQSLPLLCLGLCLLLMLGTAGFAKEATLSGMTVNFTEKKVLFSATIKNAFTEKMEGAVKNGVPATFSFIIILENSRKMWGHKTVSEKEATHTLTYDPLTGKYRVTRSWEKEKALVTASFEEASGRMCKIENMRLTRTKKLEKGETYIVSARAELEKISLPFYLHYVLFFVSFWNVETDWETMSFTY